MPRRFEALGWQQLSGLLQVEWVVDQAVQARETTLLIGARGVGKSLIALDMALDVGLGGAWHGHATKRVTVVYCWLENTDAVQTRIKAAAARRGLSPERACERLWLLGDGGRPARIDLAKEADCNALAEIVRARAAELVIVDTLQRAAPQLDENDGKEVGALIDNLDRLRANAECAVMLVHHPGKDASKGARGHSKLEASVQTVLQVTRVNKSGCRKVAASKNNNGSDGWHATVQLLGPCVHPTTGTGVKRPEAREPHVLREHVVQMVVTTPGQSKTELEQNLRQQAGVSRKAARAAIDDATASGQIECCRANRRGGGWQYLPAAGAAPHLAHPADFGGLSGGLHHPSPRVIVAGQRVSSAA